MNELRFQSMGKTFHASVIPAVAFAAHTAAHAADHPILIKHFLIYQSDVSDVTPF